MALRAPSLIAIDPASELTLTAGPTRKPSPLDGPPGSWVGSNALFFSGNPMNGSTADDFMFGLVSGPDHTINADLGDDLVVGDYDGFNSVSGSTNNNSIATAIDLDASVNWSTNENPLYANASIPHREVYVEPTAGQTEYYSLTIGAGQTITVDIDYGENAIGGTTQTVVELYDSFGNFVTSDFTSVTTDGGFGSTSTNDPFLNFTVGAGGTYYVRVREFSDGVNTTFEGGETFLMNVSVTGHAIGVNIVQGNDTIDGGSGADELFGTGGNDSIIGGSSADLLHGGSGNDTLLGGFVVDTVFGGDGNDLIRILDGEFIDNVDGGLGTDTLDLATIADQAVSIDLGAGTFGGFGGPTTIAGIESVIGSTLNDTLDAGSVSGATLSGGDGDDFIDGGSNFQTMFGDFGNDTIFADSSFITGVGDSIDGGSGNDSLIGAAGGDTIRGGTLFDTIDGGDGDDLLDGGFDFDTISGGLGNDTIFASQFGVTGFGDLMDGGADNDSIIGGGGADVIEGGDGVDTIDGGDGNDTIDGGLGLDVHDGGLGVDTFDVSGFGGGYTWNMTTGATGFAAETAVNFENALMGGGNDSITGNSVANSIVTGGGNDTATGTGGNDTIDGGIGNDDLGGGADEDSLLGGDGADTLDGVGGADTLNGGTGGDLLIGGNGADSLIGAKASDTLAGGAGKDKLNGGTGPDRFDFASTNAADADKIADFVSGEDEIALDGAVFGLALGALPGNRFVLGAAAGDGNDRLIYDNANGKLFFDADGNGAGAQVLVATLTGAPPLVAADFIVI